jgi:hypothetical protein
MCPKNWVSTMTPFLPSFLTNHFPNNTLPS